MAYRICFYVLIFFLQFFSLKTYAQKPVEWKMQDVPIYTRWSKLVNPQSPLPEYPRPQMERAGSWQNLNGLWRYCITKSDVPMPVKFDKCILVPYPLESALSGVKGRLEPDQILWYKRLFHTKIRRGRRTILHFGAVDYKAWVFLNGVQLGVHEGGYTSFSFDITDKIKNGENELIVKVYDPSEFGRGPHGKQVLDPMSIYYTSTSGIWQTVWLETIPFDYIKNVKLTPSIDRRVLDVMVQACNNLDIQLEAYDNGMLVSKTRGRAGELISLPIKNVKLWSPDTPFLYDLKVKLLSNENILDEVKSYFGMRKVEIQKDINGFDRIYLNGKAIYNLGILDQGFWPDGLYTAPVDDALKFDIEVAKAMGFNTIRKHIKIEPDRWYYYADRIGVLVWQDFVNPNQKLPEGSKPVFEEQIVETLNQLYNFPSIVTWVIFNEKWGQYDQGRLTKWIKSLDSSRLVNGHSGELLYVNDELRSPAKNPYKESDIVDVHSYPYPQNGPSMAGKANVIGEFGGVGVAIEGHLWDDMSTGWGYNGLVTSARFNEEYRYMVDSLKRLMQCGLSASIYTQLCDVESEQNGFLTYDRETVKMPLDTIRKINANMLSTILHRDSGDAQFYLTTAETIEQDYFSLLKEFNEGKSEVAFLRKLAVMAKHRKDTTSLVSIGERYIAHIHSPYVVSDLKMLRLTAISSRDKNFKFIVEHSKDIELIPKEGERTLAVAKDIIQREITDIVFGKREKPQFEKLEHLFKERYGDLGEMLLWQNTALYYYIANDMPRFVKAKRKIHDKYPESLSVFDMNNDAWAVFQNTSDKELLREALKWSRIVILKESTGNHYDTYANLLYKLGRVDEAIRAQESALRLPLGNGNQEDLVTNLKRMRNGEPTW